MDSNFKTLHKSISNLLMCYQNLNRKESIMSILKINETPVRTSKSFNINNMELKSVEIPKKIDDFTNVSISDLGMKTELNKDVTEICPKFGLGDFCTKQTNNNSNYKANITINNKMEKKFEIEFLLNSENKYLIENIEINAMEQSKSTIVLKYQSDNDITAYHNGSIRVNAKEGSVTNIIILNFLNKQSTNLFCLENSIDDNAKLNYFIIDLGGKNSITNYYSNIIGKNADNQLNAIYIGKDEEVIDLNYIAELCGEKSNINIEVQGALKDKAIKHFKGTIDFKRGCKKATGNENENCMLLSDSAKSLALPMLLCSEEDVEGNHSTSSGKIGDKELFYIMSRGFEKKEAIKLMVKAKFNQILEKINDEAIRNHIVYEINNRLD